MADGTVFLVGAGPGDPGLLTIKGKRCLEAADAIVYDRLASPRLLAYAKPNVELYYVGKSADDHTLSQENIEQLLVSLAKRGLNVVRLKGGDPCVFGRGGEEARTLSEAGIRFEVVPGITSAVSVPAYAGIPVTYRNVSPSFTVVTGHLCDEGSGIDWDAYAKASGTLVILMGVRQLPSIVTGLLTAGKPGETPIALVRWGTRANQETLVGTLADIVGKVRQAKFKSPAVIIVGDVVKERAKLAWYEQLPLMGKRIFLAASTRSEVERMAEAVEVLGAEAFVLSTEQITKALNDGFAAILQMLDKPDARFGVYFQSPLAVDRFFRHLKMKRMDLRRLANVCFGAANETVASALETYGIVADGVGTQIFMNSTVTLWWFEEQTGLTTGSIRANQGLSRELTVHPFRPVGEQRFSPWISVARDWLAGGADVLWCAPGSEIVENVLKPEFASLASAVRVEESLESMDAEGFPSVLGDLWWSAASVMAAVGAL
ncbi:uroporphyrinogen-III C-methyltransferase [Alicyclobacillus dauci]|uniref:uroporphyrinogen-III C-methyltransferase n=1 Tax=Alicyclobacillus dauci TaxID=1475485 RepID=A0ABY6Z4Q3_9BACL|nr:uroporphyrinogen-III C-methyltransferase [Alicyclobacillus dauci]WAH37817.1 uroporphyrinogen-III C-methyltransferase [Alicyclobacillus dauci]